MEFVNEETPRPILISDDKRMVVFYYQNVFLLVALDWFDNISFVGGDFFLLPYTQTGNFEFINEAKDIDREYILKFSKAILKNEKALQEIEIINKKMENDIKLKNLNTQSKIECRKRKLI